MLLFGVWCVGVLCLVFGVLVCWCGALLCVAVCCCVAVVCCLCVACVLLWCVPFLVFYNIQVKFDLKMQSGYGSV